MKLATTLAAVVAATLATACAGSSSEPASPVPSKESPVDHAQAAPAVAAVVAHPVVEFAAWKAVFDEKAPLRHRYGIHHTHVNRSIDDANMLFVYHAGDSASAMREFLALPELKDAMREAGVAAPPTIVVLEPVEDRTIKDRALPGAIIRHSVADFVAWKQAFDGNAAARQQAGIIGHAVNRVAGDAHLVVVYLQASDLGALRTFLASPDLAATMQRAGVTGPPSISLVEGDVWGD